MKQFNKLNISIFIALLFHVSGVIGILCTTHKHWFIQHTPINLLVMFILLLYNQPKINIPFIWFTCIVFVAGLLFEIIGVNTGLLFGVYQYGNIMGYKLMGVPLLMGIQWAVIIICSGTIMYYLQNAVLKKMNHSAITIHPLLHRLSNVIDGALLATFFDFIMEPIAMQLNFWNWKNNAIPMYNYLCWFIISSCLLWLFNKLQFNKTNQFAIHLFIIQLLFFIVLRIFL